MENATPVKRTQQELNELKNQWRADPYWDIEGTEGFEAHQDELVAYRGEWEAKWNAERLAHLEKRAEALGCPGNVTLAQYVETLEYRLDRFAERLETLEAGSGRF